MSDSEKRLEALADLAGFTLPERVTEPTVTDDDPRFERGRELARCLAIDLIAGAQISMGAVGEALGSDLEYFAAHAKTSTDGIVEPSPK